ncbi:hypothetical protein DV20_38165 [Amycolatopsis rifamycinica]|uniref:Uncharacterized protein n=1 Tax=Amycolatopsis rifamycinica TaxID=287986 RepID=A0A066TY81_9PSEU|nr:hypothetical protein DV20_38165 [Amycolatopsis rifamycinica]
MHEHQADDVGRRGARREQQQVRDPGEDEDRGDDHAQGLRGRAGEHEPADGAQQQAGRGGGQVGRGGQAHGDAAVVERQRPERDGGVRRGRRQEGEAEADDRGRGRFGGGGHRSSLGLTRNPNGRLGCVLKSRP